MKSTKKKIDRLYSELLEGKTFTTKQIRKRFNFATDNAARAAVSVLRKEGHNIERNAPWSRGYYSLKNFVGA